MNKHMVLYLILVLLAVLGLGGMAIAGGIGQKRVDIQVETLEGDVEQARDLRLTLPLQADDHTLWETTFSPLATQRPPQILPIPSSACPRKKMPLPPSAAEGFPTAL